MTNDVISVVANCEVCKRFKTPKHPIKNAELKIFREGVLHGKWHVDICGKVPKTAEGYEYILIAVEAFSGWPVMVPLFKQCAKEIAMALITHVFSIFGSPISILTDQGKAFESQLFKEIMELYHIRKYRTSTFHPSANGKAERWIKTLKQHLSILVHAAQKDWVKYLPFIAQAYRSLPHSVHKFSPYEVMFGAPMRTPLTLTQGIPPHATDLSEQPSIVRESLAQIHDIVREMHGEAATKMKQYYDLTATLSPFKPGDKVFLYRPRRGKGISPKLTTPWEGPYTVRDIINDCNARIEKDTHPFEVTIVHMDRLVSYPKPVNECAIAWLTYL